MFEVFEWLADVLIFDGLGFSPAQPTGQALHFFVYDTLKIVTLLFLITSLMGIVNAYFPIERIRSLLSRHRLYGLEYVSASLFGAVTPFCSCSSVPLFIGFVKGGIPLGVTFAFLITSPLVNEVAVAMFVGMFGWKVTVYYVTSGIVLGTLGGWILGRLNLERYLADCVQNSPQKTVSAWANSGASHGFLNKLPKILHEALGIVHKVWVYVVVGIGIGALLHGFLPTGFFEAYIRKENPFAVPLAVILAVPLYSNAAGVLPIVQVLVQKGIPLGTAIAFMMAVVGLSLPEAMLLKKVMQTRLIVLFFGVVALLIIFSGYLFNMLL